MGGRFARKAEGSIAIIKITCRWAEEEFSIVFFFHFLFLRAYFIDFMDRSNCALSIRSTFLIFTSASPAYIGCSCFTFFIIKDDLVVGSSVVAVRSITA